MKPTPVIALAVLGATCCGCYRSAPEGASGTADGMVITGSQRLTYRSSGLFARKGSHLTVILDRNESVREAQRVRSIDELFTLYAADGEMRKKLVPEGMNTFDGTLMVTNGEKDMIAKVRHGELVWEKLDRLPD